MREPIGTTRKGQAILGGVGLIAGIGGGIGLASKPKAFEPILEMAIIAVNWLFRTHIHYDPAQRIFFALLLPILGAAWAILFAYAFIREPARNCAIDAYLRHQNDMAQSQRAISIAPDDRIA